MEVILFADNSSYLPSGKLSSSIRMAGSFRLATELRLNKITCQIIDYLWSFSDEDLLKVCKKFITSETKAIGFSSTFWWNDLFLKDSRQNKIINFIIDYVRTHYPQCHIVCGGANSGSMSSIFKFDKVFKGYSDYELVNYVKGLKGESLGYQFDFTRSFIRYENNDLINCNDTVSIEISRGCIFKCKFCAYPLNGKKKLDYIKDRSVLRDELIENYQKYKITNYVFNDDTFNDSTYKLTELYEMFKTLPFQINFTCYLRLDLLDRFPEQIPLLYDMGLRGVFFGIESFNEKSAKIVGKGLYGDRAKDFIEQLKTYHWKNEVLITVGLISGLPFETIDNMNKTIEWITNAPIDSIGINALHIENNPKRTWLSEFDLNHKKYGYILEPGTNRWSFPSGEISSYDMAKEYEQKISSISTSVNKGITNSNFALFLWPNLIRYTDYNYTLADIIKMSGKEKVDLRKYMWQNDIGARLLTDYKTRLNSL